MYHLAVAQLPLTARFAPQQKWRSSACAVPVMASMRATAATQEAMVAIADCFSFSIRTEDPPSSRYGTRVPCRFPPCSVAAAVVNSLLHIGQIGQQRRSSKRLPCADGPREHTPLSDAPMHSRRLLIAVAAATLTVGGWLLLTHESRSDRYLSSRQAQEHRAWNQLARVGQREVRSIYLRQWPFAAVVQAPEGMPFSVQKKARGVLGGGRPLGLDFNAAKYVTTQNDIRLWVVLGKGVACMFRELHMAASCTTRAQAFRHGIVLQTYQLNKVGGEPTTFTAIGIAPDGVRAISMRVGDRRMKVPVVNNTYWAEASKPISVVPPHT